MRGGDANFNGKVDGGDYARIDAAFNAEHSAGNVGGWFNGDFDGNVKIDGSDYSLFDAAFNSQGNVLRPTVGSPGIGSPAKPQRGI